MVRSVKVHNRAISGFLCCARCETDSMKHTRKLLGNQTEDFHFVQSAIYFCNSKKYILSSTYSINTDVLIELCCSKYNSIYSDKTLSIARCNRRKHLQVNLVNSWVALDSD